MWTLRLSKFSMSCIIIQGSAYCATHRLCQVSKLYKMRNSPRVPESHQISPCSRPDVSLNFPSLTAPNTQSQASDTPLPQRRQGCEIRELEWPTKEYWGSEWMVRFVSNNTSAINLQIFKNLALERACSYIQKRDELISIQTFATLSHILALKCLIYLMHKDILVVVVTCDKSKAFCHVEPLHFPCQPRACNKNKWYSEYAIMSIWSCCSL